jgi:hypothetical protein
MMRKFLSIAAVLLLTVALGQPGRAQDTPKTAEALASSARFYHLVFLVQELGADHKPVNSRTYTTTVSTDPHFNGSIRTGSRIPIETGPSAGGDAKGVSSWQYMDVGVNFDILHVVDNGREVTLDLSAEISGIADAQGSSLHVPVIRQNRWRAAVVLPLGKETTVFSSDSLDSTGSMQLLATATALQ